MNPLYILISSIFVAFSTAKSCSQLLVGQYLCDEPELDYTTYQLKHCHSDGSVTVNCTIRRGLHCDELNYKTHTFTRTILNACHGNNAPHHGTTMLLSVFGGWLGLDRFYLGYYSIGALKLVSLGFYGVFHLLDIILVALELVRPADGSDYRPIGFSPMTLGGSSSNYSQLILYNCVGCFN
ncbi:unnamed protein product [Bursaphelenchus xylophilus]|uniref:(pine wood nematode) hypothetical protein n=1 Tax=Bursaphelenchus xylophilus TaxID=6326 RepID=A0A7I8WGQ2_BURXY|nr:unnamed protein product [Bursaphelenchus xylophilus]CAG9110992.1 unnamed protein product [Bursaphelenchus xylophilus]